MERKRVIIKKESKIKKNEENRTEFSNAGLIRTTKSEIFSELSLIETEIVINRDSVDCENCSTEIINGGSTLSKRCLEIPKMRIKQKDDSIKPATLDNFGKVKNLKRVNSDLDNKPCIATNNKDGNLNNLNEVSSSAESFSVNTKENCEPGDDVIFDGKHGGCNSSKELYTNTKEDFKRGISGKYPINYHENEESQGIKLTPKAEINVRKTSNIPTQISCDGALNLASAGKVSNINTKCNNLPLQSPSLSPKTSESQGIKLTPNAEINVRKTSNIPTQISCKGALNLASALKVSNINTKCNNLPLQSHSLSPKTSECAAIFQNHNKRMNKSKILKDNYFLKKVDIYEHGDNTLVSSKHKKKYDKAGVYKGKDKINKSVTYLVNYFENMKNPTPKMPKSESVVHSSEKRKLFKTIKQQKRKLTDDQSFPNKKIPSYNSSNSKILSRNLNADDFTTKRHFVSKNIGILKKSNDGVQSYAFKTAPNFNFNDDSAEFCVVKCRQTQTGARTLKPTPRQPRVSGFPFPNRLMKQSDLVLKTSKSLVTISPDTRNHTTENIKPIIKLPDKLMNTQDKNAIDDSSALDNGHTSTGEKQKLFSDKTVYHHKKFNKSSFDEKNIQKSNLALEKKICMNNPFHLKRHIKVVMGKVKEQTYEEEKGKSLKQEESSFAKCFSSLILFMVIFAFGSYYQFFK